MLVGDVKAGDVVTLNPSYSWICKFIRQTQSLSHGVCLKLMRWQSVHMETLISQLWVSVSYRHNRVDNMVFRHCPS